MEFKKYHLSDLYTISSGLSKKREEFGFGYDFLTFKDVFHNIFIPEKLTELANTTDKERHNCSIKEGDVFLTRTSEKLNELGLSSVALKDYPNATFNGFTKRLRPNKLCNEILLPKYAAFYYRSQFFREQITSFASMTTRASLNNEMISKLTIEIPSLSYQRMCINVLDSLLQKENLNYSIIDTLDQLSQTLFKKWFIDFDFPNEEGQPYKTSGGEMIESDLGLIPAKWTIVKLSSITTLLKKTFNPLKTDLTKVMHFSLPAYDKNQQPTLDNVLTIKSNKWLIEDNCVIFSKMNPRTPRVWLTTTSKQFSGVASSEFVVLKNESEEVNSFIYNICKSEVFNKYLISHATGSTNSRQRVTPTIALQFPVALDKNLVEIYSEKIVGMSETIKLLSKENAHLQQIRNIILPKLMAGDVEPINEVEA